MAIKLLSTRRNKLLRVIPDATGVYWFVLCSQTVTFFKSDQDGFCMDKSIQHISENAENYSAVLTVHDLARYLQLSDAMIYRMARARKLPFVRIGKSLRFQKNQIDEWFRDLSKKNLE